MKESLNLMLQVAQETKVHEKKDYIGLCSFCTMGVSRDEMAYENNRLFHSNCFEQQGKSFPTINQDLMKRSNAAKIELVRLRNLKIRNSEVASPSKPRSSPKKKKSKKKTKRKTKKRKAGRRRPSRTKAKRRRPSRTKAKRRRPSRKRKAGRRRRR